MGIPELLATYRRRAMMTAAAACVLGATIASYMDDQQTAARMLASKVDLPKATILQAFDDMRDLNLLRETSLIGEVNLQNTATVNLGDAETPRWVEMVPVFGVSPDALPLAKARILNERGLSRRPMPRGLADVVGSSGRTRAIISSELRLARIRPIERAPALAVIVRSVAPDTDSFPSIGGLGAKQIGGGANGALVEFSGALLSQGSTLASAARATIGGMGNGLVEDGLFFVPVPEMRGAPATIVYQRVNTILVCLSFFFLALAVAPISRRRTRHVRAEQPSYVRAAGRLPSVQVFQPIRGQDDLEREVQAAVNQNGMPNMILRNLNRAGLFAVHHARRLRNPR